MSKDMTVAQFDRLFKKAQKADDQKALKKMNNLLVKTGKAWVCLHFRTRIWNRGKKNNEKKNCYCC